MSCEPFPCPFCSSAPLWLPGERHVICEKCLASAPPTWWNRRPDSPEVAQLRADWRFYRKGFIQLADALGGVSRDDAGRIGDVMSAEELLAVIKQLQRNADAHDQLQKHRRKLAKRRWLRTADQGDADHGHIFEDLIYATWVIMWRGIPPSIRTWIVRSQMKIEMQNDRERNPELLRFLRWQETFCPFVDRARADDIDIAACFAPSQKIDFSGIEEKGKP